MRHPEVVPRDLGVYSFPKRKQGVGLSHFSMVNLLSCMTMTCIQIRSDVTLQFFVCDV
jgi:hypothetical protein